MLSLDHTSQLFKLLADPTRARLLLLLEQEELTVAELVEITRLAQSRVSTHLSKLREAGFISDRKAGVSTFYQISSQLHGLAATLWNSVKSSIDDPLANEDSQLLQTVIARRDGGQSWADSVAADMRRHYSPGRTFEATARSTLELLALGRVIDLASGDGALAEVIAPRCAHIDCFDISEKVVAAAAKRLQHLDNVQFSVGDMHAVTAPAASYDVALLMHALTYTKQPATVAAEIFRVLKPGGRLVAATLAKHNHVQAVTDYNHVNTGFEVAELAALFAKAGFEINLCEITSREARSPQFEVITLLATKP